MEMPVKGQHRGWGMALQLAGSLQGAPTLNLAPCVLSPVLL